MATNLQVDEPISATGSEVTDQNGNASPLLLTNDNVAVGTLGSSTLTVHKVPKDRFAHLSIGDPNATAGQTSAKISFAGNGIEHAGFAWIPNGRFSNGKLHLTFGGRGDPTPRSRQPARVTFQANGNVGIGTTAPQEKLEVNGNILATGDVQLSGADCAEHFRIEDSSLLDPGTVMVIGDEETLYHCTEAYDRKVAGIISGAGNLKPGIILGKRLTANKRIPLALSGKVFCKADADHEPICVGDMLTTSLTPGHAMKAVDPGKAFGAVIGKALRQLSSGRGLIPVLVSLQ